MKSCNKCEMSKSLSEFPNRKTRKGEIAKHSWCKNCLTKYKRNWNHSNSKQLREYVFGYLYQRQCIACGNADVLVLEFDHRDSKTKLFNIGKAITGKEIRITLDQLIAEIDKCDVVCRNCHQRKTHATNNSWRYQRLQELNYA